VVILRFLFYVFILIALASVTIYAGNQLIDGWVECFYYFVFAACSHLLWNIGAAILRGDYELN
jgi:hypothetical protein